MLARRIRGHVYERQFSGPLFLSLPLPLSNEREEKPRPRKVVIKRDCCSPF